MNVSKLAPIAKAVTAFVAGLATFLAVVVTVTSDGTLTVDEMFTLGVALVAWLGGTLGVHQIPNRKG